MPKEHLSLAPVHRLLSQGAASEVADVRVSKDASKLAKEKLEHMLRDIARECAKLMAVARRKTLTKEILLSVVESRLRCGLSADALDHKLRKGESRGLAQASVLAVFDSAFGDLRTDAASKAALVSLSEAVLKLLGQRAGLLVKAAKRSTIQGEDVATAFRLLQ